MFGLLLFAMWCFVVEWWLLITSVYGFWALLIWLILTCLVVVAVVVCAVALDSCRFGIRVGSLVDDFVVFGFSVLMFAVDFVVACLIVLV